MLVNKMPIVVRTEARRSAVKEVWRVTFLSWFSGSNFKLLFLAKYFALPKTPDFKITFSQKCIFAVGKKRVVYLIDKQY